jgi:hypothetical protein
VIRYISGSLLDVGLADTRESVYSLNYKVLRPFYIENRFHE